MRAVSQKVGDEDNGEVLINNGKRKKSYKRQGS
jgi:hypothetical protein